MPSIDLQHELVQRTELPPGWTEVNVAVALSGGADSTALLRVVDALKQQEGGAGQLSAIHVNHKLRGDQSDEDVRWCRQQCEELGLPLRVLAANTEEYAQQTGQGLEAAARDLRYQLLSQAAEQAGVRYLATAHTRDDQVETILFRILRGTGLRGLAGIPRSRSLTESITLIRPLREGTRVTVIDFLKQLGQTYRTDDTNRDQQFSRNRLRHGLLPQLRAQFNSELDEALLRLAAQAGNADAVIDRIARELLDEADLSRSEQRISFRAEVFSQIEPIVVSQALRLVWRQANLAEQEMTYQWWTKLADLVQQPASADSLNLPGNIKASNDGEYFVLEW